MKTLVILIVLALTGGVGWAADIAGYTEPGVPFKMVWTPASGDPNGYLIERALNGGEWSPAISVIIPEYTDTLISDGVTAQYRVKAYRDDVYTDIDGTFTQRVFGPVSDVSDTVIARTGGAPPSVGGCGKPKLLSEP